MMDLNRLTAGYAGTLDQTNPPSADEQASFANVVDQLSNISKLITKFRRESNFRTYSVLAGSAQPLGSQYARIQGCRCYLDIIHNPSSIAATFSLIDGAVGAQPSSGGTTQTPKFSTTIAAGALINLAPYGVEFVEELILSAITPAATLLFCGRIRW